MRMQLSQPLQKLVNQFENNTKQASKSPHCKQNIPLPISTSPVPVARKLHLSFLPSPLVAWLGKLPQPPSQATKQTSDDLSPSHLSFPRHLCYRTTLSLEMDGWDEKGSGWGRSRSFDVTVHTAGVCGVQRERKSIAQDEGRKREGRYGVVVHGFR
ncbi:uncharacterized protein LY89DRAFT_4848 [Mollisia scopiformis]|uniref:Uncharacterized protein n=1 Tax=Mollisia scopiformis TaxID=149040 RepID=A0A194XU74_MOLSC|nr:uncharacterized protein LY89DRAFT_4848 [Mollisia scopiformis]KUJ23870.1 hypothetical protein LY89DRAFT_4848 [Mollisia scopiformis]